MFNTTDQRHTRWLVYGLFEALISNKNEISWFRRCSPIVFVANTAAIKIVDILTIICQSSTPKHNIFINKKGSRCTGHAESYALRDEIFEGDPARKIFAIDGDGWVDYVGTRTFIRGTIRKRTGLIVFVNRTIKGSVKAA